MKKTVAAALIVMTIVGAITGCRGKADIGKEKATEIALKDASLSESDVTRLRVSRDTDDGQRIYEVKFTCGNTEYEYEILASDGDILSADYDGADLPDQNVQQGQTDQSNQSGQQAQDGQQAQNGQQNPASHGHSDHTQNSQADVRISMDEASQMALDRVPGATAQDLRIELDYDDGYYKYEGDIIYDQKEYEFEIDADTGDFLEWTEERR